MTQQYIDRTFTTLTVSGTNDSSGLGSGSLIVQGGTSLSKNTYIGGHLDVTGNLIVRGKTTVIDLESKTVEDKTIILSQTDTPTTTTANASGIQVVHPTGNKKLLYYSNNDNFNFNTSVSVPSDKYLQVGNVNVLSNNTLGSSITSSSLTSVGVLDSGDISSNFGNIDIGNDSLTAGNVTVGNLHANWFITGNKPLEITHSQSIQGLTSDQLDQVASGRFNTTFTGSISTNYAKALYINLSHSNDDYNGNISGGFSNISYTGSNTGPGSNNNNINVLQSIGFTSQTNISNNSSKIGSVSILGLSESTQNGYNIGGRFNATGANLENIGLLSTSSNSGTIGIGLYASTGQTIGSSATHLKSLRDSGSLDASILAYNPDITGSNKFAIYAIGNSRFSGNISIGSQTNPMIPLEITSARDDHDIQLTSTTTEASIRILNDARAYKLGTKEFGTGDDRFFIRDGSGSSDRFSIDNTGIVRIHSSILSNSTTTGSFISSGGIGVSGNVNISQHISIDSTNCNLIPYSDASHDLGSSSRQWKDLYVNGISYLDKTNIDVTDGNCTISGSTNWLDIGSIGGFNINTNAFFRETLTLTKGTGTILHTIGDIKISNPTQSGSVILKVPITSGNATYYLPHSDGSNGQKLTTDGSGVLTWTSTTTTNLGSTGSREGIAAGQDSNGAITFKSIVPGTNVSFSSNSNEITISAFTGSNPSVTSLTASGAVTAATLAGTLSTAAQTNVTSLGTLTSLTVDNININGTTIGHTSDTDLLNFANGSLTVNGTINVGSNGTGHDVTFYGDTSGKSFLYDQSANKVLLTGLTQTTAMEVNGGNVYITENLIVDGWNLLGSSGKTTNIRGHAQFDDTANFTGLITTVNGITSSGSILLNSTNKVVFSDTTNTYIAANGDEPEDLEIHADQDILLKADNSVISDVDILPASNNSKNLGNSSYKWAEIHSTGVSTTTVGPSSDTDLLSLSNNALTVNGTITSTGQTIHNGGVDINGNGTISGQLTVENTTNSTSTSTGSLIVNGGAGIAGNVHLGNNLFYSYEIFSNTGSDNFIISSDKTVTFIKITANANCTLGNPVSPGTSYGQVKKIIILSNSGSYTVTMTVTSNSFSGTSIAFDSPGEAAELIWSPDLSWALTGGSGATVIA